MAFIIQVDSESAEYVASLLQNKGIRFGFCCTEYDVMDILMDHVDDIVDDSLTPSKYKECITQYDEMDDIIINGIITHIGDSSNIVDVRVDNGNTIVISVSDTPDKVSIDHKYYSIDVEDNRYVIVLTDNSYTHTHGIGERLHNLLLKE